MFFVFHTYSVENIKYKWMYVKVAGGKWGEGSFINFFVTHFFFFFFFGGGGGWGGSKKFGNSNTNVPRLLPPLSPDNK